MPQTQPETMPRTAPPPAAPGRAPSTPGPLTQPAPAPVPVQAPPTRLDLPTWGQRLTPATVRNALDALGMWQNPTPQPPSGHLEQVLAALEKHGWTRSVDISLTGRMCIRGAQTMLQRAGYVTPQARRRAVHYLHAALREWGVDMQFFSWNDLPDQTFECVHNRITRAIHLARSNGE